MGDGPTVSAVGIYEPVTTLGLTAVGALASWAVEATAPSNEPAKPARMILDNWEMDFRCSFVLMALLGLTLILNGTIPM